jgi:hypothetical protein
VAGKAKYKIIEGARYCNMHGLRMLRYGRLDVLAPENRTSHNKGGTSATRTKFTEEQIAVILLSTNTIEKISRDFGVTAKVIKRVKMQGK